MPTGEPIQVNSNRQYLARAARLGFREICLFGKSSAVFAHDERRQYVWILLTADDAIPPAGDALRIASPLATNHSSIHHHRTKELNVTQINPPAADVPAATAKPAKPRRAVTNKSPVEQAIELRDALHVAARQANELARSLKRQRRQNRLVETTHWRHSSSFKPPASRAARRLACTTHRVFWRATMLKLNVNFSRKVGEANYSSRGASVSLELEADSGLAADPERLKQRIHSLFLLAKASVDEELNGQGSASSGTNGAAAHAKSNGKANGQHRDQSRRATASQVRALHAIADRQGIELSDAVPTRYGVDQAEAISITEASELIDQLKGSAIHGSHGGGR